MPYYKLISREEILAICEAASATTSEWHRINRGIDKELGTDRWWWVRVSQAEFETYQAFGFKELKIFPASRLG